MGGPRSGRHFHLHRATCVEDLRGLDVRSLHRDGGLTPGVVTALTWSVGGRPRQPVLVVAASDFVTVLTSGGPDTATWREQQVRLDRTACHFGGARVWFRCPDCDGRVALLYASAAALSCRHCLDVPYRSQRDGKVDRAIQRARKIRCRLGMTGDLRQPVGPMNRPKWMRWSTFTRLVAREHAAVAEVIRLMGRRLGR